MRAGAGSDFDVLAMNLGEDADTTAAVYGQLAEAFYGEAGIPAEWLAKLTLREETAALADQLRLAAEKGGVNQGMRIAATRMKAIQLSAFSFHPLLLCFSI